jgi:hypothetical protein
VTTTRRSEPALSIDQFGDLSNDRDQREKSKTGRLEQLPESEPTRDAAQDLVSNYGFERLSVTDPFAAPLGSVLVYGTNPYRRSCRDPHAGRLCERFLFENAIAPSSGRRLREVVV